MQIRSISKTHQKNLSPLILLVLNPSIMTVRNRENQITLKYLHDLGNAYASGIFTQWQCNKKVRN